MSATLEGLQEELRVLRARIAEMERQAALAPWLRAIAEQSPGFVVVVDREGRLQATGRASEGFGAVEGRTVYEFTDPGSHDTLRRALARVVETGEALWYEVTGYGEDGTPGHAFRVRAIPLGSPGRVEAIALLPTDITDLVKLERAIADSEQALRLAVGATRMGMWRWDVVENKVHWDERLLEIWGLPETPATYEAYREHIHPDDRERVARAITLALETGEYPTLEHRIISAADGAERHVLAVGTVVKDERGRPVRLMGGLLDITDRKRLEAQLSRASRVEVIGQLTAGIAHNFNNLLTVIIPSIEMVIASPGESSVALPAALEAALQARDVVKHLLELARSRADDTAAVSTVGDAVARVLAMCRTTFPREIELSSSVDADVPSVAMSASELEQVLLNLLFNARDALEHDQARAERGPRAVRVRVDRAQVERLPWVRIRVSDNGVGMPPDVRARIFEPFFTTKPPHRGSGLGLAHVLLRVQQAGGRLDCTSAPGMGATFEILLPEAQPVGRAPVVESKAPASSSATILLVDDEPLVRRTLRHQLERAGYAVVEARSAAEARAVLDGARGQEVALVILDQSMPGETGVEALPSLRARSRAPVVLYSGMVPDVQGSAATVLAKPARPAEVLAVIRRLLREASPPG